MAKLDIEKIKSHVGLSAEELAEEMEITLDELQSYVSGACHMSSELLSRMCEYTGLGPGQGGIYVAEKKRNGYANTIKPDNTFEPAESARTSLVDYVKQGVADFRDNVVTDEIVKLELLVNTLRKPRITFAGKSDAGKSTLINSLLGTERMPTDFTPTTSIIVYIKHIDDKPAFIKDNVWILGKPSGDHWDASRLNDESYCKDFLIAQGDYTLLSTFGTHQGKATRQEYIEYASAAVTFIDSPLLKNCDILDVPGYGVSGRDDVIHKFNTQENATDILIYMSVSNSFLQESDIDYLRDCIKTLRPVESKGKNNLKKLENLFVLASQAGNVEDGNASKLNTILDRRSEELCSAFAYAAKYNSHESLLPARSAMTGYVYTAEDMRSRFFTYEKDMLRLCKKFNAAFTESVQNLPKAFYAKFNNDLEMLVGKSSKEIQDRVDEWRTSLQKKEQYCKLYREIKEKEPARIMQQSERNERIHGLIGKWNHETKQEVQANFNSVITIDKLIALMEDQGVRDKKDSKERFASQINEALLGAVQKIVAEKAKLYSEELSEYLEKTDEGIKKYGENQEIRVKFNTNEAFAYGLASLGVFGASAAWLANSFTAFAVFHFGAALGWSSVFAVGGIVGIALGSLIVGAISLFKKFTWRKNFAKAIVEAYEKENYLAKVFTSIDNYWSDTKKGFDAGARKIEDDWKVKIKEYSDLADEKNIPKLQERIEEAERGLDFFTKIPMPKIG